MGVYHLMGLGRSAGAVTGPLSYLAHCYQRWNKEDQKFFARSGEAIQRQAEQKVGAVQAIVLFTTPEVLMGKDDNKPFTSFDYIDNPPGRIAEAPVQKGEPMRKTLSHLLKREWPGISGGRKEGEVYWCQVDRRDIRSTYERVIRVVTALAGVGGQGKEMWANLTGGNNVINFALELAATLSGEVARLYYVQAENPMAEKCVRFTAKSGYWVDLPVMPLALGRLTQAVLELLKQASASAERIYSKLGSSAEYWNLLQNVDRESFLDIYLKPMWKQGLITEIEGKYGIGAQWELIQPYQQLLQQARQSSMNIHQLAAQEDWIHGEEIKF